MPRRYTHFDISYTDGVAVVALDVLDRTMNVVDEAVLTELGTILNDVLNDSAVIGMVLTSGKPGSFGGGADLTALPELAADPTTPAFLERTHALMLRMLTSAKPLVAAIDGHALGGALELALGCGTLVATDRATLGLPESTLGLIPGGGGSQLILRRLDPVTAIGLMVSGRSLGGAEALDLGLIDDLVAPDELLGTALARARTGSARIVLEPDPTRLADVLAAGAAVRRPPSIAAQEALLDCMRAGITEGIEAGLAAERAAFLDLLGSDESAALIHLFHAETGAKRRFRGSGGRPTGLGVVGAGQMGAGIAATAVAHGFSTVVRDIDAHRIAEARARAERSGAEVATQWAGTTEWQGFDSVDVVVEAVFELPELKRETLSLLDAQVDAGTLITTNTSAIPVASLADAVSRPEDFLGTHFFSPVERMPLVELVPHEHTSDEALDRAGALSRTLGKVPVVVADYPGFFTSRVYARWILEGIRLLVDGTDAAEIETGARDAGFPLGPLQACDEVTLELVRQASVTQVAERVLVDRLDVLQVKEVLSALIEAGHQGKRFGSGFYRYVDGRRDGLHPGVGDVVAQVAPRSSHSVPDVRRAGERLLMAFVTEALLCWDDGTLCHPDDGDVASVLGIGFPRSLGGPFHWVDRQDPAAVVAKCRALDERAFPVGATLARLAAEGGRFADEVRRARPGLIGARVANR